ncbi:MAG: hypothetical protein A2729_03340 [Candidatus Buchananbacteria bacterium RIFCSPHIGHO2_01_FULL_39_14]|uniref:Uncharacterized protein n=2 Tax=Candidatus Buchananiibacteriota TaxID=1817903 RepID=A0A1G1YU91_9BACT|nr:MAG: hypothetical protein A2729_03340 [Candidatus Buchananbacteria bacterium RIFCSPHIGHO2_01_FULL_39_14]OGY48343.1 MAG: hypothetical protein A3D39_02300 [Candidatus Buchananbacteria bacterium RIFCSPHIGHO2_02_FULL_39_17]OGY55938.1 MAG: hypothetical protein A2912_03050 [Candidatus Buchananbacteria bacterium RIFCSPLOWO2_01_FULL_40_23b]
MALSGKKTDNFKILEEIYQNDSPLKPKKTFKQKFRDFFGDAKRVQVLLSVAILVLGLAGLGLGFFQFKYNLKKNFLPKKSNFGNLTAEDLKGLGPQDLLGLGQKDTDTDGLSDYDELYLYNTSPYLKDSDSDGVDDKAEVSRQSDPNCPTGKECFTDIFSASSGQGANLQYDLGTQAARLRALLAQAGLSPEQLSQYSDAELIAAYQEVVDQNRMASEPAGGPVISSASDLSKLTPAELRQLLRNSGVAQDILDSISDAELLELTNQTATTTGE